VAWLAAYAVTFAVLIVTSTPLIKKIGGAVQKAAPAVYSCVLQPLMVGAILILSTAYLAGNSFNPFLYFRF
jgi:alginate O-acetyltransferase complex protein AlgI